MPVLRPLAACCAVAALTAVGCSSSSTSSSAAAPPTTAAPATAAPAPSTTLSRGAALAAIGPATATGLTLSLARGPQGIFLIGPDGHALYVNAKDQGSTSACTATCATFWPALTATGAVTTGPLIDTAEVATTTGQVPDQLTYYGHLLYDFHNDTAPGDTKGVGLPNWNLLGPFGNVMLPRPATTSTTG